MKTQPTPRHSPGLAIVVVVALMALLMLMVLGFLLTSTTNRNISNTDTSIRQADSISDVAKETLVADLLDEFKQSSETEKTDSFTLYTVTDPTSMVPKKALKDSSLGEDPNFRTLAKQSANGVAFGKGSNSGRASSVSTATPDLNKRSISPDFWKAPALFGSEESTLNQGQVPDWIYTARDGSNPTTANGASTPITQSGKPDPKYIVGRYAYQMYDLSGLLDANVALHDSASQGVGKDAKDSPFWAVASALPGGSDALGSALANWRHQVGKTDGTKKLVEEWGEARGWDRVYSEGSSSDQAFLSRQDLIRFQKQNKEVFPPNLLSYLTHANFSLNQASISPAADRPKVTNKADNEGGDGGNNAFGKDDLINPKFLSIRATLPGEPTAPGQTTSPVAARRFPLDRIELLSGKSPNAELITKYFGLSSVKPNEWRYNAGAQNGSINKLSEVAALNREPNFFELLKATLHVGGLGMSGVPSVGNLDVSVDRHIMQIGANIIDQWDTDNYPTLITPSGIIEGRNLQEQKVSGIEDLPRIYGIRGANYRKELIYQIGKIGSATTRKIDTIQDPPPYPFTGPNGSNPIKASDKLIDGWDIRSHANGIGLYSSVFLKQPVIWNPHAIPSKNLNDKKPNQFRVIAVSEIGSNSAATIGYSLTNNFGALNDNNVRNSTRWPGTDTNNFSGAGGAASPIKTSWNEGNAFITFTTLSDANERASFRSPQVIKSLNYPPGSNASGAENHTTLVNENSFPTSYPAEPIAIGFKIADSIISAKFNILTAGSMNLGSVSYQLQYRDDQSNWVTYDTFQTIPRQFGDQSAISSGGAPVFGVPAPGTPAQPRRSNIETRIDPRTSRLGIFHQQYANWESNIGGANSSNGVVKDEETHAPNFDTFKYILLGMTTRPPNWEFDDTRGAEISLNPFDVQINSIQSINSNIGYFADADGVVRPSMGANSKGINGLPLATPANPKSTVETSRPRILNRPFRSVAELGYVFKDIPWRQLDFNNPESMDGPLLDAFCLHSDQDRDYESPRLNRGRVNLNSAAPETIAALLENTSRYPTDSAKLSKTEAKNIADELVKWVKSETPDGKPFTNRGDIIGSTNGSSRNAKSTGFTSRIENTIQQSDRPFGERRDTAIRALTDSSDFRTWNLMFDVVAQSGELQRGTTDLAKFSTHGQSRRWIFLSIDRFTGEILHQSVETVTQ